MKIPSHAWTWPILHRTSLNFPSFFFVVPFFTPKSPSPIPTFRIIFTSFGKPLQSVWVGHLPGQNCLKDSYGGAPLCASSISGRALRLVDFFALLTPPGLSWERTQVVFFVELGLENGRDFIWWLTFLGGRYTDSGRAVDWRLVIRTAVEILANELG